MNDRFWLVWDGESYSSKHKHNSFAEAETEASRLSEKEPNKKFCVLENKAVFWSIIISHHKSIIDSPVTPVTDIVKSDKDSIGRIQCLKCLKDLETETIGTSIRVKTCLCETENIRDEGFKEGYEEGKQHS